ncbi:MAG: elongation factor Ts [Candidatus Jacksonbacteria bacterium RIFOXYA2_FULL_44_7]|uniref:Elongation factor Ts n=1 Tax=Candidatus Jacksonbacteria bacterium RIFCSPLOWO2_02_FULL_44_20 TaxID=1798460 RepID=A0A1G2ABT8_9BACT|nr:MAG: Elongation factor Ts [Parcubacteria group bacterium GW2011_GWC2_44_17]KKT50298.1 MAG: Elongation factor Ts [Parcubacteria group bacterium GW2011_GWF2_44_17]OGY70073.1 MAG: elongation factor Ts [Candidatus Jacksonbacteria bacterium RIFCSPHIGHO2_12_FULL_44_12]OGY71784.1 MAG: elongation factor Ts [Candidatus Jacksonbacteria bacterium RIFCSPHIGHO2_02_FULL_44_25]OGY73966.1 MAG: elongation factor Ts [Candidatus Jacksonbacteria bacterium RIFCSPLOWO2_02_FULL_44_20]OGY74098.1 MAG: elongation fa
MIDIQLVKKLRDETGAGVVDCRESLEKAGGNITKAKEILRKIGVIIAAKKSSRQTGEGAIGVYVHTNGKLAALVSLRSETDFVARNNEFKELAKDLAMQVAAMQPLYRSSKDIPSEVIEKEIEIETEKLSKEGKPAYISDTILDGKLRKYYETVCLLNQPFVKDDTRSVESVIQEKIQKLGENIEVGEFVRMVV